MGCETWMIGKGVERKRNAVLRFVDFYFYNCIYYLEYEGFFSYQMSTSAVVGVRYAGKLSALHTLDNKSLRFLSSYF